MFELSVGVTWYHVQTDDTTIHHPTYRCWYRAISCRSSAAQSMLGQTFSLLPPHTRSYRRDAAEARERLMHTERKTQEALAGQEETETCEHNQAELEELRNALGAAELRASDLVVDLEEARREATEWRTAVEEMNEGTAAENRQQQESLAESLLACKHELALLLRAIRAQMEGGDAITVLLDDNGMLDPSEAEQRTSVTTAGASAYSATLAEAVQAVSEGMRTDLEVLREIVSTKSAENAADGCVIS